MCVDSLLLKFNSDEKQLTRLFISVFAFDCTFLKFHQRWSPPVVVGRPCDVMHSRIGMTITLPGHPMSVTQHYFNLEKLYNFILVVVYSFASFTSN